MCSATLGGLLHSLVPLQYTTTTTHCLPTCHHHPTPPLPTTTPPHYHHPITIPHTHHCPHLPLPTAFYHTHTTTFPRQTHHHYTTTFAITPPHSILSLFSHPAFGLGRLFLQPVPTMSSLFSLCFRRRTHARNSVHGMLFGRQAPDQMEAGKQCCIFAFFGF